MSARRSAANARAAALVLWKALFPDLVLCLGAGCAMYGAFALSPWVALVLLGLGLVALAIWMGA